MSYELYRPDVAKFGGSSAAHPEQIREQNGHPENRVPIMVISAPGRDQEGIFNGKLTNELRSGGGVEAARPRFLHIADRIDPAGENTGIQAALDDMPADFSHWEREDHALEAIGEYWSAKLFAAYSGREFVDAADIILLDGDGQVDVARSNDAIRRRFQPRQEYIVPGYYGRGPDGRIRALEEGGSDTTGAIIAAALRSRHYYNNTDVNGYLSGTPGIVPNGTLRDLITYREGRELALGGCELLSADSFQYLLGSGVDTVICNTFGEPGHRGTVLTETRDWQDSPIASITGRHDLVGLSLHRSGLDGQIGGTKAVFEQLDAEHIPYHHLMTGTDDIAVLTVDKWEAGLAPIKEMLQQEPDSIVRLSEYGSVHIVGEGIADRSMLRRRVSAKATSALADVGREDYGDSNNGDSAGLTMFVDPESLRTDASDNSLRIVHDALEMYLQKQTVRRRIAAKFRFRA